MAIQSAEKIIRTEQGATRPPIVVVLGHVDHGKSSLLEAIREDFRITQKESGGITQHFGAYEAEYRRKKITFLDTPGHEVFSAMRARGAKVADIAVLVVAANEGVKPQTVEAIEQIKKAGIPTIVALNKIDKPEANGERVQQELAEKGVVVEPYGGTVPVVATSATKKLGIDELMEMILLVAEVEDLKADQSKPGNGVIIESSMNQQRGPTATILVRDGQVQVGDYIGTPTAGGRVRILEDFQGNPRECAFPSMPAAVVGFLRAPRVGEAFRVFPDEESLKEFVKEEEPGAKAQVVALEADTRVCNLVLKADVEGSLEALEEVLGNLPKDRAALRVLASSVGDILENDVKLARSAKAPIFGFRVRTSAAARELAEREDVSMRVFDIIYELVQAARELLEKEETREPGGRKDLGSLLILAVFAASKKRQVVGGRVLEGEVRKGARVEIMREGALVGEGRIENVQHEKKDVSSVSAGKECGISFEGEERIQAGDHLLVFLHESRTKS